MINLYSIEHFSLTHLLPKDLFFDNAYGYYILAISLLLYGFLGACYYLKFSKSLLYKLLWISVFLSYLSIFLITQKPTDEIFINLEQSYNLFNFGIFSFSPLRPVSGTTDMLFYLFLSMFAYSRETLILSAHFINFLLGFGTMYFVYKIINPKNIISSLVVLNFYCFYAPLIEIYSNLFPNSIIGFLFVLILYLLIYGRRFTYILYSILPLIRVDAILITGMSFVIDTIIKRRINYYVILITSVSYFLYFALHRYFFNFSIPTPLKFKSFKIHQLEMLYLGDYWHLIYSFFNPFHIASIAIILYCSIVFIIDNLEDGIINRILKNKELIILSLFFIFSCTIFVILEPIIFGINFDNRYFVFMEIMFVVFPMFCLVNLFPNNLKSRKFLMYITGLFLLLVYIGAIINPTNYSRDNKPEFPSSKNKNDYQYVFNLYTEYERRGSMHINTISGLARAGMIIDKILPEEWSIAIHEMSTFSYFNDREIIDLWGYTNEEIANSNVCSTYNRIRSNPDTFWSKEPEVLFTFVYNLDYWDTRNYTDLTPFYGRNFLKDHNLIGDVYKFFKNYDLFMLDVENRILFTYIRKDKADQFQSILNENNFNFDESKKIDMEEIKRIRDTDNPGFFKC